MQRHAAGAEPIGEFADMLFAVGVIHVLPRAEYFNRLRSPADQFIEQAGMQPLFHVHISRDCLQHGFSFPCRSCRLRESKLRVRTSEASLAAEPSQIFHDSA